MRVGIMAGHIGEGNADLRQGLRALGIDADVLEPEAAVATLGAGDVAIVRLDILPTLDGFEPGLDRVRDLRLAGVRILNPPWSVIGAHDKLETARRLSAAGLPHPKTLHVRSPLDPVDLDPPLVVKPRFGSWGVDVFRCGSEPELRALLRSVEDRSWFRRHGALVQELLPPPARDLRLVVAGGAVVGAAQREPRAGEWRTNVSLGGRFMPADPDHEGKSLAVAALRAIGGDLMGVDLLPLPGGGYTVLEVNGAVDFDPCYSLRGGNVYEATARALGLRASLSRDEMRENPDGRCPERREHAGALSTDRR